MADAPVPMMVTCPACGAAFTPPPGAKIPFTCPHCGSLVVGPYCDLALIGSGAMGEVFSARRPNMRDQRVAIKIPKKSDAESRRRFEREIAASAMLRHENIVRAFDCGEVDGHPFLGMELESGQLLEDVVRTGHPLSCRLLGQIIRDVASGLVHAKRQGIINRDIKPENILVTAEGSAKILDFGLATIQSLDGAADRVTGPGIRLGTPAFMSPEQARDPRDVTPAADIYSLGCTAYYALAARTPFRGSIDAIHRQHAEAQRPSIRELRPDVPPVLSALLERMMAIDPRARPSAEAVLAEVYSYGHYLPDQPLAESRAASGPSDRPGPVPALSPSEPGWNVAEGELLPDDDSVVKHLECSAPAEPAMGELLDAGPADATTAYRSDSTLRIAGAVPAALDATLPYEAPPVLDESGVLLEQVPGARQGATRWRGVRDVPTIPLEQRIDEGAPIAALPITDLVAHVPTGPSAAATPATKQTKPKGGTRTRNPHQAQHRRFFAVVVGCVVLLPALWFGTQFLLELLKPQTADEIWEEIQLEYQEGKFTVVRKRLGEFREEFPDDPHVEFIPFFEEMCEAGRDVRSQTGDPRVGLEKLEAIFLKYRDTKSYENYHADLFLDFERLTVSFLELTQKKSQPDALAAARKSYELMSTVAKAMPDDWVPRKVEEWGGKIQAADKELQVKLVKQSVLEQLEQISASAPRDSPAVGDSQSPSTDERYELAKDLLAQHSDLQTDKEIVAAFSTAYASEANRVTYVPVADDSVAEAGATIADDETIYVVWDQPSTENPIPTDGVRLALADGVLYAFDEEGRHSWSRRLGIDSQHAPQLIRPAPESPQAVLAVSSIENALLAFHANTGQLLWSYRPAAGQDLAAPLTVSRWRPSPTKPERIRGLLPTAAGEVHVLELVRGRRMGTFHTHVPMTVGGVYDPTTQLLYFPADNKRVFALDPAVIEARESKPGAARSVLFTNHLSGAMRSAPAVVGPYLLLTELSDLENTKVRVFDLSPPNGFTQPDAAPLKEHALRGWSWFTPPVTPDRITVITDSGELGVLGLNLDNRDEALYPLIQEEGRSPTLAIEAPYRALAIHSDEHLLWVMAGGQLRQIALDVIHQKINSLWPADGSDPLGLPLQEATFDRVRERIYVATRSVDMTQASFMAVDANTGERLWTRQLGIHPVGDPLVSAQGLALLVDRSGRLLQLALTDASGPAPRLEVLADDLPLDVEPSGDLLRLHDPAGREYLVLPVEQGHKLAVRPLDVDRPVPAPWEIVSLPVTDQKLQGRPAIVEGNLLVPASNGSLYRVPLADSNAVRRNEQTYAWATESTLASTDHVGVYPLGEYRLLVVAGLSLRWL